jgi:hypothetical protein
MKWIMATLQDLLHMIMIVNGMLGVLSTEETDTGKIIFIYSNELSVSYTYPTRLDTMLIPKQDILMNIYLCSATEITYTQS